MWRGRLSFQPRLTSGQSRTDNTHVLHSSGERRKPSDGHESRREQRDPRPRQHPRGPRPPPPPPPPAPHAPRARPTPAATTTDASSSAPPIGTQEWSPPAGPDRTTSS